MDPYTLGYITATPNRDIRAKLCNKNLCKILCKICAICTFS